MDPFSDNDILNLESGMFNGINVSEEISTRKETFNTRASIIDKDEQNFHDEWGLPFNQTERSLSGIEKSDISINFMPENDSLFTSLRSRSDSVSPPLSLDNLRLSVSNIRLSEDIPSILSIANVLKNMPEDSNPLELMDNILSLNKNDKKDKYLTAVVTAGVGMSACFNVEESSDFDFTHGDEIDILVQKKSNILQLLIRAHFVGERFYKNKFSDVFLKVESLRNEMVVTPNEMEFGEKSVQTLFLFNKNKSTMKVVLSIKDAKKSNIYFENKEQEVTKSVKPDEKLGVPVYFFDCHHEEKPFIDIYFAHPPGLKTIRVQCAKIPIAFFARPKGEELIIDCTSHSLVWGCVKLNETAFQKCVIRNASKKTENLILSFSHDSFIFEDQTLKNSLKITLPPNKQYEIKVHFKPKTMGQYRESIIITRDITDGYKKLIHLYAFGGKGNLLANNIAFDLEKNSKKILINDTSLTTHFSLENNGDGLSFFIIEPLSIDLSFISVSPKSCVLLPGEKADVTIKLVKFDQSMVVENNEVNVSTLTICQGDEPTRLRLKRLYHKHKANSDFFKRFQSKLVQLLSVRSHSSFDESQLKLKDSLDRFPQLYKEGVRDFQIDVAVNKDVLQHSKINATQEFLSLEATIQKDDTIFTDSIRI